MNAPVRPKTIHLDPVKEAQAVAALREALAVVDAEDETLLLDSIEGETDLYEAIDKLLVRMTETRANIVGLDVVIADLGVRKRRYEARVDRDRAVIEQAMTIAELPKLERPTATLSMSARAPSLRLEEEADIPAEFWKAGEPKLDRKALLAALKEGRAIPGVCLSNAAPSLSIRNA